MFSALNTIQLHLGADHMPGYDLVAVGTRTAAKKFTLACRMAGWSVAVAGDEPFGGTCPFADVTRKTMWSVAEACDRARRLRNAGTNDAQQLSLNMGSLDGIEAPVHRSCSGHAEQTCGEAGIDTFHGHARFLGPNAMSVGENRIDADHVLMRWGQNQADREHWREEDRKEILMRLRRTGPT